MGFRPEEKGIKTSQRLVSLHCLERWDSDLKKKGLRQIVVAPSWTVIVMGFRPEEKGIKTGIKPHSIAHDVMGFRPEEKGIKTTYTLSPACSADGIPT